MKITKKRRKVTERAKFIYKQLFKQTFPKDWEIVSHIAGATDFTSKRIYLPYGLEDTDDLNTLVHELFHLAVPWFPHGKQYERVVKALVKAVKKSAVSKG